MSYAQPRPDGTHCIDLTTKAALGLPLERCSCRSKANWMDLYSFVTPFEGERKRVFLCRRCDEQVEVPHRTLVGRTSPESPRKLQWTDEMKLHLMETPRRTDWGDNDLPREIAPPEGHEGSTNLFVLASLDGPSPLHPLFRESQ